MVSPVAVMKPIWNQREVTHVNLNIITVIQTKLIGYLVRSMKLIGQLYIFWSMRSLFLQIYYYMVLWSTNECNGSNFVGKTLLSGKLGSDVQFS